MAPKSQEPSESAAFRVFNEIGIVSQLSATRFEAVMPHRLTLAQFSVLNHFSRLGGEKNIGRLAKAFQVSKATMSGVVANLERKGYVTVRPDPSDRRGKLAGLSPGGLAARNDAIAALLPGLKKIEASFGAARLKSMLPGLSALREHLDKNR